MLGRKCRLVRQSPHQQRKPKCARTHPTTVVREAESSVDREAESHVVMDAGSSVDRKAESSVDRKAESRLSLANEAQYLLLSLRSVEQLLADVKQRYRAEKAGLNGTAEWAGLNACDLATRFRANFIVGGDGESEPHAVEKWKGIRIGSHSFQVSVCVCV